MNTSPLLDLNLRMRGNFERLFLSETSILKQSRDQRRGNGGICPPKNSLIHLKEEDIKKKRKENLISTPNEINPRPATVTAITQ